MSQNDDSDEDTDRSLDLSSKDFDPLRALYCSQTKLPCPNAPVLDNLTKFEAGPSGITIRRALVKKPKEETPEPSTSRNIPGTSTAMMRDVRRGNTVFTRMDDMRGPLALLRDCVERRVRIKIVTRDYRVRGYCIAFVAAFDKFWNLGLEDVKEVWTRKIKKKYPSLGPGKGVPKGCREPLPPPVHVTKIDKTMERCERHVPQLLLRGEHVVIITLLDGPLPDTEG